MHRLSRLVVALASAAAEEGEDDEDDDDGDDDGDGDRDCERKGQSTARGRGKRGGNALWRFWRYQLLAVSIADPLWQTEFSHLPESARAVVVSSQFTERTRTGDSQPQGVPSRKLWSRTMQLRELRGSWQVTEQLSLCENPVISPAPLPPKEKRSVQHSKGKHPKGREKLQQSGTAASYSCKPPTRTQGSIRKTFLQKPTLISPVSPLLRNANSPSLTNASAGQTAESPGQTSAVSHSSSTLARQTVPAEEIWHVEEQQPELIGSQTAPGANLHVVASQQLSSVLEPGSQSSPSSRIPLPQDWRLERGVGLEGWRRKEEAGRTR